MAQGRLKPILPTICEVEGTTVTLHLQGTGHRIRPNDMRQILIDAQEKIASKFFESTVDQFITPSDLPFTIHHNKLILRAQKNGWSWKLLNYTIIGVRQCAYEKGIFEEIFINSIQDPRALDPHGGRFFNLVQRQEPSPPPPVISLMAPRPPPPGLQRCHDVVTQTRLEFEPGDWIRNEDAMQKVYDEAQDKVEGIIRSEGDRMLGPQDLPLEVPSHGLQIMAKGEGWSCSFLKRTIAAMRKCTIQKGNNREVLVYISKGANAPPGERYVELRKIDRLR
ncbi:MAG: hypothetical protein Q9185_004718 [Variospora sp. 1 TL-2023]